MKNSEIGLGTAAIGRPSYINIRKGEKEEGVSLAAFRKTGLSILESAYDQGIRYFDTAPGYGMAEDMIIEWAKGKKDPSIEVATKWGYTYVADFDPQAQVHEVKDHSLSKLSEQWASSKDLLPKLSTYQIHSATFETGVLEDKEVLTQLANLKNEHNILIGITTTGANQADVLGQALEIRVDGEALFEVFQVTYNIFDQSLLSLAKQIANERKRLVVKEALANGRIFPNVKYGRYCDAYEVLGYLADKYKVGVDAIALRFCIDSIPAYRVLSGASEMQHLSDNLKVSCFKLEEQEVVGLMELAISPKEYWKERKELDWN